MEPNEHITDGCQIDHFILISSVSMGCKSFGSAASGMID